MGLFSSCDQLFVGVVNFGVGTYSLNSLTILSAKAPSKKERKKRINYLVFESYFSLDFS